MSIPINVQQNRMNNTKKEQVCGRESSMDPHGHGRPVRYEKKKKMVNGLSLQEPRRNRVSKVVTAGGTDPTPTVSLPSSIQKLSFISYRCSGFLNNHHQHPAASKARWPAVPNA